MFPGASRAGLERLCASLMADNGGRQDGRPTAGCGCLTRRSAMPQDLGKVTICIADEADREAIYRIRHDVYAGELSQHPRNTAGRLTDPLDAFNTYIVARRRGAVAGFVAITPPNEYGYSLDKYFPRGCMPFKFDQGLYEVRLLTVRQPHRGTHLAALLMYAALQYVESRRGTTIAGIGRLEVLEMYKRA